MSIYQRSSSLFVKPTRIIRQEAIKVKCQGFDSNEYEDHLDYCKMNCYDGVGKLCGVVKNGQLTSIKCSKTHDTGLSLCCACSDLLKSLKSKQGFSELYLKLKQGDRLSPVVMNSPRIIFKLLNEMADHVKSCPISDEEVKFLQLYRRAKSQFDKDWNDRNEIKEIIPSKSSNPRITHINPSENCPDIPTKKTPFEETFFVKFLENQLNNYSRPTSHHVFDETMKRFWIVAKYFSGKQFFTRMGGNGNHNTPCNWRSHLQYNLIMPSISTFKNWVPKGSINYAPYLDYVIKSLTLKSCKKVCVTIDGMKVLKKVDNMSGIVVGTIHNIDHNNLNSLKNIELGDICEEMLYFNLTAIDNSWYAPIGWFPISPKIKVNNFVIDKVTEINEKLSRYSLKLICGCADGEVDAPMVEEALRKTIDPNFIFVNDFVHNFKNQRNVLFSGLDNVSMSTIINTMSQTPSLYKLLDREQVSPSDIMNIESCLKLTSPTVIKEMRKIVNNPDILKVANYLDEIRFLYDCINTNDPDLAEKLDQSTKYFEKLKLYPAKTREICLHTIKGFRYLISHNAEMKSSCITTNYNELLFSIIRRKYPRPTVKQFCSAAMISYYIFLISHTTDDVRGFSLPDSEWTDHYNGMNLVITEIPPLNIQLTFRNVPTKETIFVLSHSRL